MKYKVVALDTYQRLSVADKDLGYIVPEGTVFEVDEDRLQVLLGNNSYNVPFVSQVEDRLQVEEEPKKKSRKKSA